jgi:hypothetical protein
MHFATRVRTWRIARLYSETALSRKPFGIGHIYIYTFSLEWPTLWHPRIMTLPPGIAYIYLTQYADRSKSTLFEVSNNSASSGSAYRICLWSAVVIWKKCLFRTSSWNPNFVFFQYWILWLDYEYKKGTLGVILWTLNPFHPVCPIIPCRSHKLYFIVWFTLVT